MPSKPDKPITIKHGYPAFKKRIQHTPEILHAMDRVCTAWSKSLGTYATFTIDSRRFAILSDLLINQGRTAEQLGWAIMAYGEYVTSSDWHRQQGGVHKTFESFLTDQRLEDWIAKGDDYRERRQGIARKAAETKAQNRQFEESERRMARFYAMQPLERQKLLLQIVENYEMLQTGKRHPFYFNRPIDERSLRVPLLRQLLQKWLQDHDESGSDVDSIGDQVNEVLTG